MSKTLIKPKLILKQLWQPFRAYEPPEPATVQHLKQQPFADKVKAYQELQDLLGVCFRELVCC